MPDSTMNGLPAAAALTGTEILPMVQSGGDRQDTLNSILAFIQSQMGETVDDRVAALLVDGANISLDYNDGTNTLEISAAGTNLAAVPGASSVAVSSNTGTGATIPAATGTEAGVMTAADKVKLNGIASGATANSSDAFLLSRANHTDTQLASTISNFSEAVDDRVATLLVAGTNVDLVYDDSSNTLTISTTGTQVGVGFQDEGVGLGTSGTVTVVDFVGAGVTASRVSNTLTVTVPATQGRHSIPVLARSIQPSVTGGCAPLSTLASAANQPDIQTLDFDAITQEYAQFSVPMPKAWNEGTVTFKPIWSHAATVTDFGVSWDLQAVAVSNDDAIAVAYGTAQLSTDTGGTTDDLYIGPESAAITIAGTPSTEDVVFFRLSRVTGDAGDTLAIDARLHGIVLYITTDAENDA